MLLALSVLLALPVAAGASVSPEKKPRAGDGTLAVVGGRGQIDLEARGAVIVQVGRGVVKLKIEAKRKGPRTLGTRKDRVVVYRGKNIRVRVVDSRFRIEIEGVGIHLSAVGNGKATLQGDDRFRSNGSYSLNGEPFKPIPLEATKIELAAP